MLSTLLFFPDLMLCFFFAEEAEPAINRELDRRKDLGAVGEPLGEHSAVVGDAFKDVDREEETKTGPENRNRKPPPPPVAILFHPGEPTRPGRTGPLARLA